MDLRLILTCLAWLALLGIALWPALLKEELGEKRGRIVFATFCLMLALFLLLARWRSLTFPGEISVDEGSTIAQGLKYLHDPIPWRSVDGITCGPLSTWVALWAPLVGLKLSFFSLRLTSLMLIVAALAATALCTREIVGKRFSLLCVFPAATLLASTLNTDFLTFALEYLPVAMASGAVFLILSDYRSPHALKVYFVGFITGAMPFSKLQAAPSAVFLFLVCAALIVLARRKDRRLLLKHLACIAGGGLTVPALMLAPVILAGAWHEFLDFYLFAGAAYKNTTFVFAFPLDAYLVQGNFDFGVYWIACMAASTLFVCFVQKRGPLREWGVGLGILLAYLGTVLFSVLRSGFNFPHYLLLLIIPVTLITAWALKAFLAFPTAAAAPRRDLIVLGTFGVLAFAQVYTAGILYSERPDLVRRWDYEEDPVVPVLSRLARPGDSMAIWGWANKYHAWTGIRPATRFVGTAYVTDPAPRYDRHRRLFLEDLKRDKPRLFVDAVDEFRWPTWPQGALAQHEMLPELAEWVRGEYSPAAEIKTSRSKLPVRIYVRKTP